MTEGIWIQRKFIFDLPVAVFPAVVERLRSLADRAEDLTRGVPEETLARRVNEKWSAKEHLGHLTDLYALDNLRLEEFLRHAPILTPGDIYNRATEDAHYREVPIADILQRLRSGREPLIRNLELLSGDQITVTSLHPRLQQPMQLLDWAYFVAEHDDHHLEKARLSIQG